MKRGARLDEIRHRRFVRVADVRRELCCSKRHVFGLLRRGALTARKLDGLLLVDAASLDRYIASAKPWHPGGPPRAA